MRDTNSCKRFDKTSLSFKVFFYYCYSGNFKVWSCFDFDILKTYIYKNWLLDLIIYVSPEKLFSDSNNNNEYLPAFSSFHFIFFFTVLLFRCDHCFRGIYLSKWHRTRGSQAGSVMLKRMFKENSKQGTKESYYLTKFD